MHSESAATPSPQYDFEVPRARDDGPYYPTIEASQHPPPRRRSNARASSAAMTALPITSSVGATSSGAGDGGDCVGAAIADAEEDAGFSVPAAAASFEDVS